MSKRSRSSRSARPATPAEPVPAAPTPASATRPVAPAAPRRTRALPATAPRPPLERYRGRIIGALVVAVVALGGVVLFAGAAQPAYACATVLQPAASPGAAPDATPRLGQVTRDLGRAHVAPGTRVTYEFCPPTSGSHFNPPPHGPIATRFYGADDRTDPQGWIHNLEHGQMVVLYRCPEGCDDGAQATLRAIQGQLPPSPLCGFPAATAVTVTRFDDLPTPFAAVVWDRVLFLASPDVPTIAAFARQNADRGPEPQCQDAVPGASPTAPSTAAPSATPAP